MKICVDTTILLDILKDELTCPECGHQLLLREHFLSDFYIGGFAMAKCDAILTRDRGIYAKYFPEIAGYENCLEPLPGAQ